MILPFLLSIVVPGLIVWALAKPLRAPDEAYFAGLAAAVIAYIAVMVSATVVVPLAPPNVRFWTVLVVLGPLIEEIVRLRFAFRARDGLLSPRDWVFFGVGYALYEGMAKLIDAGFAANAGTDWAGVLAAPIVSMSLLAFLGVLTGALVSAKAPWWGILPVTYAIHAFHNWSVIAQPFVLGAFPQSEVIRIVVFLGMSMFAIALGLRLRSVTSAHERANTHS